MNRGSSTFLSGAVFGATQAAETIASKTSVGEYIFLQGLTESLKRDSNFVDLVTLWDLTNDIAKGSPTLLLLYALISNVGKVHSVNKFLKMRAQMIQKQKTNQQSIEKNDSHEESKDNNNDVDSRHDG